MYGNRLSNKQIEQMVNGPGPFIIAPYRQDRQKLAHYKLTPARVLTPSVVQPDGRRSEFMAEVGNLRQGPFQFGPRQYLIVEVFETIRLPEGIIGDFTAASTLIEQAFGLVAGKLDSEYGKDGERILLGLYNLLDRDNVFDPSLGIAHISFHDFRGTERRSARFTDREMRDFRDRRLDDHDAINYHLDDPE